MKIKKGAIISVALVMLLTVGGFMVFTAENPEESPGISTGDFNGHPIHDVMAFGFSEDIAIEMLDANNEVRPAIMFESVYDIIEMTGQENVVFNPPLDPVNYQSLNIDEPGIILVLFVCEQHTSSTLPRELVINTPATFTIPDHGIMDTGSNTVFNGWVDADGTILTPGTLVVFEAEVRGVITLIASWS